MKITQILALSLAGNALAEPMFDWFNRRVDSSDAIDAIGEQYNTVDKYLNEWKKGHPMSSHFFLYNGAQLADRINDATKSIEEADDTDDVAASFRGVLQTVDQMMGDLATKKTKFVEGGIGGYIKNQLTQQEEAVEKLQGVVDEKVPAASNVVSKMAESIDYALKSYSEVQKEEVSRDKMPAGVADRVSLTHRNATIGGNSSVTNGTATNGTATNGTHTGTSSSSSQSSTSTATSTKSSTRPTKTGSNAEASNSADAPTHSDAASLKAASVAGAFLAVGAALAF